MNFSNKIDVQRFMNELRDHKYCVIKLDPDFPNYTTYSDIDIFCYDLERTAAQILDTGKEYLEQGWKIKTGTGLKNHLAIDLYEKRARKLDFRFDLYGAMPSYKKINIKPGFFSSVIEHAVFSEKLGIYIPTKIDDAILRYIEYVEWFDIRADKIKHVDYIMDNISDDEKREFLDKLHFYTQVPEIVAD